MSPHKVQHGGLLLWCQNPELHSWGPGLCGKSSTLLTRYRWKESALENGSHPGTGESFIGDGELFRGSSCHLASAGRTVLQEGGGWPGSSSPLPSFLYPLRETRIPEMRRDGVSAERKCRHIMILLKNNCSLFPECLQGLVTLRCAEGNQTFPIASGSCSHPFRCLLLPLRQISEEGGCEEGGGQ